MLTEVKQWHALHLCWLREPFPRPFEIGNVTIPILHIRKLRQERGGTACSHRAGKKRSSDRSPHSKLHSRSGQEVGRMCFTPSVFGFSLFSFGHFLVHIWEPGAASDRWVIPAPSMEHSNLEVLPEYCA